MGATPIQDDRLVWLDGGCHGRELVGGKGASLSQLLSIGAPVPPAITFTTHAYRDMAAHLDIGARLHHIADGAHSAIRQLIAETPLPDSIQHLLCRGWSTLRERIGPDLKLAVRSSAIDEDSASHSFAGLHDTVLGVRSEDAFLSAVRQCWASLWTDRSIAYRRSAGLFEDVSIAVIAQQLVHSDVSFVAFSADPVTGNAENVVINATWGLGESIVSGSVTPDQITISPSGRIVEYAIGDKQTMVIADDSAEDGTREVPVPRSMRRLPSLSEEHAIAIAVFARNLAQHYGRPIDLEGGLAGDRLHVFQARPITTATQPAA